MTKIGFLGLGASSSNLEFAELQRRYDLRPDKNPDLVLVNGNRGAQNVVKTVTQWADYDTFIDQQLAAAGVSADDIGYIWLKTDDSSQKIYKLDQQGYLDYLKNYMVSALNLIHEKFPGAKIMLTGRHDGYAEPHLAPRALYNDMVCQQICIDTNASQYAYTEYGPSFFQQCVDGVWDISCVQNGEVHPNEKGLAIACDLLENWLVANKDWYTKTEVVDPPAEVQPVYTVPDIPVHNVGFHWGPHAFDNPYTEEDYQAIVSLSGGAGSTLPLRFRVLNKGEGTELGIDYTAMPNFFAFLDEMKNRGVIIQGVMTIYEQLSAADIIGYIAEAASRGMQITAFEIGNECYSQYTGFAEYLSFCQPLIDGLNQAYPGIPIIFPVAGRPSDSDLDGIVGEAEDINTSNAQGQKHAAWNNALAEWLSDKPEWYGVAPHLYPNQREFVTSPNIPMDQQVIDGEYNDALADFFGEFTTYIPNGLDHIRKSLTYCRIKFAGRKIYITEFGTPQAELRNTIAFSGFLWNTIINNSADYWYFHSGISATTAGARYPAKKIDTVTGNVSKLEWLTIQLYRNIPENVAYETEFGVIGYDKDLFYGITANWAYEGCGHSLFMSDQSKPGYLAIKQGYDSANMPWGFGYKITADVIDPPPPPPPTEEYREVEVEVWDGKMETIERSIEVEFSVDAGTYMNITPSDTVANPYANGGEIISKTDGHATLKGKKVITYYEPVKVTEKRTYYEKVAVDQPPVDEPPVDEPPVDEPPVVVDPPVTETPLMQPGAFVKVPSANCNGISNFYPGDWYINGCKSKKVYEQSYLAYQNKYPDGIMNMEVRHEDGRLILFYPDLLNHSYNVNADVLRMFPEGTIVYITPKNTAGESVVPAGEDPRTQVKALPPDAVWPDEPVDPPATDINELVFESEEQFRDYLVEKGLSKPYDVLPCKFDKSIRIEDELPYRNMTNKAGMAVRCIDPNYYRIYDASGIEIHESLHYLNEEKFEGKRAVIMFDHSGLAKSDREFRPLYAPEVDYRNVDLEIHNPYTAVYEDVKDEAGNVIDQKLIKGERAIFKDCLYWSDRWGNGVFNTNVKAWLLWCQDKPQVNTSFVVRLWDKETEKDLSYRAYNPDHDTAELKLIKIKETYPGYGK